MRVIYTCGLLLALLQLGSSLSLAAFNIRSFGRTKAADVVVMGYITQIVHRYDIILIQELRDQSDLSVTATLMTYVNQGVPPASQYRYTVSEPLGPSTYKERYLFLYRAALVSVVDEYTYGDPSKIFSRPPFVVKFSSSGGDFVLIPQHTSPSKDVKDKTTVKQVDALYDVVNDVKARWKTDNILLLGDFNAGCTYITNTDWVNIRLFTDKTFHWLIPDSVDTTVSGRNCPYDRIVATTAMMKRVVTGSAAVFNYKVAFNLDLKTALAVSDHYPVEVTLT